MEALRQVPGAIDRKADLFAAGCSAMFAEPACRDAWARVRGSPSKELSRQAHTAMAACHIAYCDRLDPRPSACAAPIPHNGQARDEAWLELLEAILAHDLGAERAARLAPPLRALMRLPKWWYEPVSLEMPDTRRDKLLERAPIVSITPEDVSLGETRIATTAEIMDAEGWKIRQLDAFLRTTSRELEDSSLADYEKAALRGMLVLQADRGTRVAILNKVLKTAYAAGYPNVMFAIKKASPTP